MTAVVRCNGLMFTPCAAAGAERPAQYHRVSGQPPEGCALQSATSHLHMHCMQAPTITDFHLSLLLSTTAACGR